MPPGPYSLPFAAPGQPGPDSASGPSGGTNQFASPLPGWLARRVSCVLPATQMLAMWRHSLCWDVAKGGCFEVRSATCLLLWPPSSGACAPSCRSGPLATVWLRWLPGPPAQAVVERLAWNAAAGGTEDRVWAALELLAGRPLRAG